MDPSTEPSARRVPSDDREVAETGTGEHWIRYSRWNDGVVVAVGAGAKEEGGAPGGPPDDDAGGARCDGTTVLHLVKYAGPRFPLATAYTTLPSRSPYAHPRTRICGARRIIRGSLVLALVGSGATGAGPAGSCTSHFRTASGAPFRASKMRAVPSLALLRSCVPRGWKLMAQIALVCPWHSETFVNSNGREEGDCSSFVWVNWKLTRVPFSHPTATK
mmetsp:Transcript_24690/g.51665  ORF Transcript_24690/g.51665 Transcript_24690/m.51665 type:complete len:218 (+) Transcript_24690:598-1251(+)